MLGLQSHYKTPALTTVMIQGTLVNTSQLSKLLPKAALLERNSQMSKAVYQKRLKCPSLPILRFDSKANVFTVTFFLKNKNE